SVQLACPIAPDHIANKGRRLASIPSDDPRLGGDVLDRLACCLRQPGRVKRRTWEVLGNVDQDADAILASVILALDRTFENGEAGLQAKNRGAAKSGYCEQPFQLVAKSSHPHAPSAGPLHVHRLQLTGELPGLGPLVGSRANAEKQLCGRLLLEPFD